MFLMPYFYIDEVKMILGYELHRMYDKISAAINNWKKKGTKDYYSHRGDEYMSTNIKNENNGK